MKLDYLDLISSKPLSLHNVGKIKHTTISEIRELTGDIYNSYLFFLGLSPFKYCTEINTDLKNWYESLSDDDLMQLSMFDIIASIEDLSNFYSSIFSFFFVETVKYDKYHHLFIVFDGINEETKDLNVVGTITKDNYIEICNIIKRFNHIDDQDDIDFSKVKSKKGLERFKKIQKLKQQSQKTKSADSNLELGNVISSVCAMHNSINYTNVESLTIYQLWDTFERLRNNIPYSSGLLSVSVWGDKENKFDLSSWFKNILNKN